MARLREALPFSGKRETAVLHGLGGIGKTQLAIAYASARRDDYTAVLWLDGRNETSLQQSFIGAAGRLVRAHPSLSNLKLAVGSADAMQAVDAVLSWLDGAGNDRWLLVIDNVDTPYIPGPGLTKDLYDVQRYLPTTLHGHMLITTRSSQLYIGKQIKLQKINDTSECTAILQAASRRPEIKHDPKVLELIRRLDGLPLALSTAGHYLYQVAVSPAEYLDLYERSWLELQQSLPGLPEYQGRTLQTTWELSRQHVEAKSPEAHRLLRLWGYLAGQDVWYELLVAGCQGALEWFATLTRSKISFDRHMRVLCDHGLVEAQQQPAGYGMHDCVHDWVREMLGEGSIDKRGDRDAEGEGNGDQGDWDQEADLALRCISLAVPYNHNVEYWVTQRRLLSHADSWVKRWEDRGGQDDGRHEYLHHLGILYADQGKLAKAEAMYERALAGKEKALGREHTSTLNTINSLAIVYANQGKLAEAEAMYQRALAGYEKALGREHTSTLNTINNLAVLYENQGKLAEAEAMFERALAGKEKALGREHTSTLDTINNLAILYADQGKLAEAEAIYERALAGKEKALGREHTSTLNTVGNFGNLYADRGKLAEAEAMYERALAGYEKALGREHTSTLDTINSLAVLYKNQGKLAEAEAMYERALAGYEKALGREHKSTLNTVGNLGNLYADQGKLAEAEAMYERALAGYEKALGREHTSTLNTINNLGNLYENQGKLAEAEAMYERALAGKEKALGREHTSTLDTINNLGNLYAGQSKLAEAEAMYERALAGYEKAVGREHTSTLDTINNLAILYADQGKLAEAEAMFERALAGKEKALGREHTSTLNTINNLGNLYAGQGKLAEAEAMYERALAGYEKALGRDHPSTQRIANNLRLLKAKLNL